MKAISQKNNPIFEKHLFLPEVRAGETQKSLLSTSKSPSMQKIGQKKELNKKVKLKFCLNATHPAMVSAKSHISSAPLCPEAPFDCFFSKEGPENPVCCFYPLC